MTTVKFKNESGRITGFSCSGHSGYAEEGSDIVCAAVSSCVSMAECIINDVMGVGAKTRVSYSSTDISLTLPNALDESTEEACQAVLTGLMLSLVALKDDYPDYIEVMEV